MKKLFLSIIGLICFSNLFAIGPIIIPMPSDGDCGSGNPKGLLALYLATNAICITIFMILSAIWLIKKSRDIDFNESYWEYTFDISLKSDYMLPSLNTICFIILNGISLLFLVADLFAINL